MNHHEMFCDDEAPLPCLGTETACVFVGIIGYRITGAAQMGFRCRCLLSLTDTIVLPRHAAPLLALSSLRRTPSAARSLLTRHNCPRKTRKCISGAEKGQKRLCSPSVGLLITYGIYDTIHYQPLRKGNRRTCHLELEQG